MLKLVNATLAAAVGLAGCVVGPEPVAPEQTEPAAYQTTYAVPPATVEDQRWWAGFEDDGLNGVMDNVLAENLDIGVALANLGSARALARAARSDLFPILDGFVDTQLQSVFADGDRRSSNGRSVGGLLAFDPDIAGRNRRRLTAARARLDAAALDVADVQRLVARAAAEQYIELRRSGARLRLLDTSLELQTRTLDIVRSRFRAGLSAALDVDRAAADLAQTRATRSILDASRHDAEYTLAVLAGAPPERGLFGTPAEDLIPDFKNGPPVGVPAELLSRRPDVRAAEARLVAELATVGVEQADLYPTLRLPGRIQADLGSGGAVLDPVTLAVSALLDLPLFDGGRRRAEVEAQRQRADAALLVWRSQILNALLEVESSLIRIEALRLRLDELQQAVASSEAAYRQLDALYREGLASFIDVLDGQRTLISTRESVVDTRAGLATAIVALYASLGLESG